MSDRDIPANAGQPLPDIPTISSNTIAPAKPANTGLMGKLMANTAAANTAASSPVTSPPNTTSATTSASTTTTNTTSNIKPVVSTIGSAVNMLSADASAVSIPLPDAPSKTISGLNEVMEIADTLTMDASVVLQSDVDYNNLIARLLASKPKLKPLANVDKLLLISFDNLPDEQRYEVIKDAILAKRINQREELVIIKANQDLDQNKQLFTMKKWLSIASYGLVICLVSVLIYVSLKHGAMSDNGSAQGVASVVSNSISTVLDIFKIIIGK